MLDEMLRKVARKRLQENAWDRFTDKLSMRRYERIGAIKKINGHTCIDMETVGVSNLKRSLVYYGVVIPAAVIAGNVCGNMKSKK